MDYQILASLTDRLFGQILDSLVAVAALAAAGVLYIISPTLGGLGVVLAVLFAILYILFADGLEGGQSYGKRIVHTACVDATTGAPCTFWQSFIRNLLLTLLGLIDCIFIYSATKDSDWETRRPTLSS